MSRIEKMEIDLEFESEEEVNKPKTGRNLSKTILNNILKKEGK